MSWKKNKEKLRGFHHSSIRRILGITWTQVREGKITNEEIKHHFFQIPDSHAFIIHHTVRYVGKVCRSEDKTLPKKLLGAWIQRPRKAGKPQYSCYNNFINALHACLPELTKNEEGLFKKWVPLTMNEESEIYDDVVEQDEITQRAITRMQNLRFENSNS